MPSNLKVSQHKLSHWLRRADSGEELRLFASGLIKRMETGEVVRLWPTNVDPDEAQTVLDQVTRNLDSVLGRRSVNPLETEYNLNLKLESQDEDGEEEIKSASHDLALTPFTQDDVFYEITLRPRSSVAVALPSSSQAVGE